MSVWSLQTDCRDIVWWFGKYASATSPHPHTQTNPEPCFNQTAVRDDFFFLFFFFFFFFFSCSWSRNTFRREWLWREDTKGYLSFSCVSIIGRQPCWQGYGPPECDWWCSNPKFYPVFCKWICGLSVLRHREVTVTSLVLLVRLKQVPEKRKPWQRHFTTWKCTDKIHYTGFKDPCRRTSVSSAWTYKRCEKRCMDVATEIVACLKPSVINFELFLASVYSWWVTVLAPLALIYCTLAFRQRDLFNILQRFIWIIRIRAYL